MMTLTGAQLALFDLVDLVGAEDWGEGEYIAAGILRHGYDLSDHQRGLIVLDWDTAGGSKKGDHIPAWICCVCGRPEPNKYVLGINHSCAMIPGCARRRPNARWPYTYRLVGPAEVGA